MDIGYSRPIASLAQLFLASAPEILRASLSAVTDLDEQLAVLYDDAAATWPDIDVAADTFAAYMAQRLPDDRPPGEALTAIKARDLYLACACAAQDPGALSEFDARYVSDISGALARMRIGREQVEEIKQLVREKLFVGDDGGAGKIVDYSGRGSLRNWVRSIAVRTCLNQMRKGKREILMKDEQVLAGVSGDGDSPELAYMKEKYRSEFRTAFVEALGSLDHKEQNLLRYHHVHRLNIDEIGNLYKVHRVTAYRWLQKARDELVRRTQKLLQQRLEVEKREFDSILRMIRSQLHLSIVRHLGELDGAPDGDGGGNDGA